MYAKTKKYRQSIGWKIKESAQRQYPEDIYQRIIIKDPDSGIDKEMRNKLLISFQIPRNKCLSMPKPLQSVSIKATHNNQRKIITRDNNQTFRFPSINRSETANKECSNRRNAAIKSQENSNNKSYSLQILKSIPCRPIKRSLALKFAFEPYKYQEPPYKYQEPPSKYKEPNRKTNKIFVDINKTKSTPIENTMVIEKDYNKIEFKTTEPSFHEVYL